MHWLRGAAAACGLIVSGCALAQSAPEQYVWEEFGKRIKASEKVAPLGPNIAGDQVSLSNGSLSFAATDVSLPGSNALKVEFSRTYSVFSRRLYGDLGMLADWLVDVPSISGVFATDWNVGPSGTDGRCSSGHAPPVAPPNTETPFTLNDFWQGLQISIPGKVNSELLRTLSGVEKPSDGPTYYWTTNERVHVSCLSSIQNGNGEGFLARTPDGTRYWFNWMGQTAETSTKQTIYALGDNSGAPAHYTLARKKNYLYVTRVEDRFGNFVTYSYSNEWNAPGKLTRVEGSDGRTLTISYTGATISSVSDGTRTWTYTYGSTSSGRKTLTSVGLPDNSAWTIDLGAFTNAEIKAWAGATRACTFEDPPMNWTDKYVGRITHPAGATAEFTVGMQEHGNSWVPISCRNFQTTFTSGPNRGADNNTNDDVNIWPTSSYSLTLEQKKIYGPGLATATWSYAYQPNNSVHMYPGTTGMWPICDWANVDCAQPPCTNDNCAKFSITTVSGPNGEWRRYMHGNTYRYNEGKLLREEVGTGPDAVVRYQVNTYDFSRVDQAYPARFGRSLRLNGDGFATEYHRPLTKLEIFQQGRKFTRNIDTFDAAARPVAVTRSSTASGAPTDPPPASLSTPTLTAPASSTADATHTLSWSAVTGAVSAVLERKAGTNGTFGVVYSGPGNSQVLNYPVPETLQYRVKVCNVYGSCSAYSAIRTVVIGAAPLATPQFDTNTPPSQVVATAGYIARWNAISGATQYVLERKVGSGAYAAVYTGSATSKSLSYPNSATLKHRVKACDASGACSTYSSERTTSVVPNQGGGGGGGGEP